MRQVHHLVQGSPEWHAHRNTPGMINGSEIAAIMGLSSYVTRSELLQRKATGIEPEYDAATLARFAKGHEYEALARPLAEDIIGDDLSALVMTDTIDGLLFSVSFDGITQGYDTTSEHKSLNQALAAALDAGYLPDEYHPQCESGLMVSGAKRCLFMASRDGDVSTMRHFWYDPNPELRTRMIAACKQFEIDRVNYVHVEKTVAPIAAPIEALPSLAVTVSGSISLTHNLERFGQRLSAFVGGLNAKPETDQDFADLDAAVKVLKEAESALDAAEKNALAQTTTIADMCSLVEMYRKVARDNRLMFEKVVKQEKVNRKNTIIHQARLALEDHIAKLNQRIGGNWMLYPNTPFIESVAGLKSLDSMRDKVSTALANAKIEANEIADRIEANRKSLEAGNGEGMDYRFLVPDFAAVCTKACDDFDALVTSRLAAHREREAEKAEAAKKAEDARVAAAVEAERTRAAAEADRLAKQAAQPAASAVCEQHTEDQRGKADAGVGLPNGGRAQPEAAITPPTPEEKRAAVVDAQDMIAAFMFSRTFGKTPSNTVRAILVEFVAYQAACADLQAKQALQAAA